MLQLSVLLNRITYSTLFTQSYMQNIWNNEKLYIPEAKTTCGCILQFNWSTKYHTFHLSQSKESCFWNHINFYIVYFVVLYNTLGLHMVIFCQIEVLEQCNLSRPILCVHVCVCKCTGNILISGLIQQRILKFLPWWLAST